MPMELPAIQQDNMLLEQEKQYKQLIREFIDSQDVKYNSKRLYERTLRQYFNWIQAKSISLSNVSRLQIVEFKEDLLRTGKSSLTVSSYVSTVRRFYQWTESNKLYPNIAQGIKCPKRKQQFKKQALMPSQAKDLLDYSSKHLRNHAIINLILKTGLRTVEVVRANIEDITYKYGTRVLMVHGKGRDEKDDFVVLTDKTYESIEKYLKFRGNANDKEPLFISSSNNNRGHRLSTRTISFIIKEALKGIGLNDKCFTAHSLRHTTAVNILRAGGDLETAQLTLRHSDPATTQIYTAALNEERRLQNSGEALIDTLY